MQRREFITLLSVVTAWPVSARAQSSAMPGILGAGSAIGWDKYLAAFRDGLRSLGFLEGRTLRLNIGGQMATTKRCRNSPPN
jgi:hypothetical protein